MKKFTGKLIASLIICSQLSQSMIVFGVESNQSQQIEQSDEKLDKIATDRAVGITAKSISDEVPKNETEQLNGSLKRVGSPAKKYAVDSINKDEVINENIQSPRNMYASDQVVIPDLVVRQAINTALKHINDWETYTPTVAEIASIKGIFNLKATQSGSTVDSLEGMQYLTGISQLYATDIKFSNSIELNKLSSLRQLIYLSMGNTNIENIDFIKGLDNLTGLVLPDNKIKDVSPSYDYYNSGNRKQYNFLTQNVDENVDVNYAETITIPPMKLTGVNGNQVAFQSFVNNPNNNFSYSNGVFIGKNLLPGKTYQLSYRFIDKSINSTGAFSGVATINITVIAPDAAPVTVKYEDEAGNIVADNIVKSGNIGDQYTTEQKAIKGYTFKEVKGNPNGIFSDKPQTVTYVYTKDPVKAADVTVKYQDEAGNKLADNIVKSGNVGDQYVTEQKAIKGYTFKEVKGNPNGTFLDKAQTVTYVYTKDPVKAADVTVKYQDKAGNKLADNIVKSGNVGDQYTTEQKAIKGYTFKEVKGNPNGIFSDKPQTVTYVYTKDPVKAADVTVKYQDEAGNKLADNVVKSGNIGDQYTTEQKAIKGYTFKEVKGNPNGTFSDKAQTVTYVYTKDPVKAADVTVKYQDKAGNKLADNIVKSGNVGDQYTTEQKAIKGYTFKEVKGNPNGIFSDKPQTVTYVYTKDPVKAADVTVKYQDEAGNKLADNVVKSGNIGDQYVTEQKAIKGYTFKEVKGNPNGTFSDKAQTVTYVYTKDPVKAADVTVKYQDKAGNKLADNVVKSGNIGDPYTTEQKAIKGYTFKEVKGNPNGIFSDKPQTVTYVYTKDPVKAADVTVKYQDEAGNKLADNIVKSGNVGDQYVTEQKAIKGYTFKEVKGNPNGTFLDKAQTVTYVYTKDPVKAADVTVKYQDKAGNKLADNIVKSGNVGDQYTTEQKAIKGYTFKEVKGNPNGIFSDKPQTVTYVYTKDPVKAADVTVKYQDEAGNKLADNVVKSGNIGDQYVTEQKAIKGYTFKEVKGNPNGTFSDKAQTVTYVYTKDPVKAADVTVKYQDKAGNKLADNVVKSGNIGDPYTTEQKAIKGYTFKEVKGNPNGIFSDKPQTVTYVYTKDPVKAADVTVKYQDEAGNKLADNVVKSGNIGDQYVTEQKAIKGYTFKEVKGNPNGTFSDKAQTVTYVYTKDPVKAADVTVKYQDKAGNKLADNVVKSGNIGDPYTTEQKAIKGYTFKEVKGNPNGIFSDKPQTVTYVYTKDPVKAADVTVKYQDKAGNKLADNIVKSGNVGDQYTTEQKAIKGYTFKEVKGNPNGIFSDKPQTVTYVYTKDPVKAADVTVKYQDEAGNKLADNVVKSGNIGDQYVTEQKAIKGYTFKEVKGNPNGTFSDKAQTVTYVYTKDPVKAADVTVKYQDKAGNKLADNVVKSGNIGDPYTTEQKAIKGYTFKEVKGNPNGIFSDKPQTVTYVYTKDPVKAADVTVKYQDEAGNKLADNVVKSGNIGDQYVTEQKAIKGYTFKEVKGNPNGTFSDKAQTVTYVYTKDPVKAADSNYTGNNDTQTKTTISNKQNNNDASKKLPQTSAKQNTVLLTIIGALIIIISGVKLIRRKE
ncbi:MucBP domain-containing protein (plasmid) [Latilactobacillus sp. 5-91]|uniref:MucBP domain-containing protein n=1 Tax=Latilactobacillus sp. 5-91 TaxID=3410924 RepID=UPI003C72CFCE